MKTDKDKDLLKTTTEDREPMTTNHGIPVSTDQNSLKAGVRGPTLLEDFVLREKIMHFDHERIPERVVHARGAAAHGYFQVYKPLAELTSAKVLNDTAAKTPVFVRFSTVAGSRGSADTARDVRGFAVKFYTQEGNWDLVGNNIPVFFIQDAIKFPDLIHAVKPEPNNEIPQASSAHDTFYDFISLTPESMHMIMWVMSDRAIPRSFAMMEGFGVHTYRLINAKGKSSFVKFHWKPTTLAEATTPTSSSGGLLKTKGLSMEEDQPKLAKGRKVAILVAAGVAVAEVEAMKAACVGEAVSCEVVAPHIGEVAGDGGFVEATKTFANSSSVLFDAVYVPGGEAASLALQELPDAVRFIDEAYKHGKPIGASGKGVELVAASQVGELVPDAKSAEQGIVLNLTSVAVMIQPFLKAIASHRFHNRQTDKIAA